MSLSPEQQAAVERSGQDVCVVAGPGSGKTRVLIERFAWLVEACHVPPNRILAITFTEKAATEMKGRLVERFESSSEYREAVERAWVSTIDGFCNRLLAENAIDAGLPPDFRVLDEAAAAQMLRESAEAALDQLFAGRPAEARALMEALDLSTDYGSRQPDLAESLCDIYEQMRLAGRNDLPQASSAEDALPLARQQVTAIAKDPGFRELHAWAAEFLALPAAPVTLEHFRVLEKFHVNLNRGKRNRPAIPDAREFRDQTKARLTGQWARSFYSGLPELFAEVVGKLDHIFRESKRAQSAVDFADLGERAIALLESRPEVRARVNRQFEYVLMDELQDTNRLQWRLVNLIRQHFFAVGDINQSIYGFRHADRSVFEEYRQEVRRAGGRIDQLAENHRSRPEILAAVESLLIGQPGVEAHRLIARRDFEPGPGPFVERWTALGDEGETIEAEAVAARILESAGESPDFSQFAILVRTMNAADPFEKALEKVGIPFMLSGGRDFLEAREIRDVLNFLAVLVNPLDNVAMLGFLRGPLMGWSDEEILRQGSEGWRSEFEKLFGAARRLVGFLPADRLIAKALDDCGWMGTLPDRARANVEKLLAWMRSEHRRRPRPLAELLEALEDLRTARTEADAPPPEAANAVSIMTIHKAKGLEFHTVFVSGLHKTSDSSTPVILFSSELGVGMKWRNPATGKGISDATHAALKELRKREQAEEENRLLYVAMTRAEHRLILSYAKKARANALTTLAASLDGIELEQAPPAPAAWAAGPAGGEVAVLSRPAAGGQYDSSVSATSVALFDSCPRKYYLSRYLGIEPEPQGQGSGAIDLGLEVHRALAGGESTSPEALDLAARFRESDLGRRAARASRVEHEFDFLLALDDVILRGQIDLWFEEGGELVLVDYKTDRAEDSTAEYSLQLRLYALALERYAGRIPDRAMLCYLRSGRVVEVGLAPDDLERARLAVRALSEAQDRLAFAMKPEEHCLRCGFYKGLCPSSGPSSGPPSSAPEPPTGDS